MGKIWNKIKKKKEEKAKPATKEDIDQLKLEVEKAQLEAKLGLIKDSKPKGKLGKLFSSIINETPERRKARLDNIKKGLKL